MAIFSNNSSLMHAMSAAVASGNLNLDMDVWQQAVRLMEGRNPPYHTVQLQAVASWVQIYSNNNMGGGSNFSQQVTHGVTTTDTQSQTFGAKVGVSVSAGWGPVSASMTAEFSAETSQSHSIAFSNETTQGQQFDQPASTFMQIWQLNMQIRTGDGSFLNQATLNFQSLTYPETTRALSQEEAQARAEKLVARLSARR
jgi:beta-glucosidase/6-phospho-beta-glucosidase/beta-galactosidase